MDFQPDPGYVRFRKGSVKLAAAAALIACMMVAAYVAGTWGERPHRAAIGAMAAISAIGVGVVLLARAERIVETRWCDAFFGAWSGFYVAVIVAFAELDGGPSSPLLVLFFPVLVFAGLCYPRRLAILVGVACVTGDLAIGVLAGAGDYDQMLFVAGSLALSAAMCGWQAHTLERQRRELALASRTDHLTGALNRRGFHERAEAELARAERGGEPLALLLVDLDGFKGVNDAHGHAAGDELLRWVVDRLGVGLRPSDAAARLGGDEFALLLPGIDAAGAQAVAGRLRRALAARTGASFGLAAFPSQSDADELLAHADAALYFDKARGRAGDQLGVELADSFWS